MAQRTYVIAEAGSTHEGDMGTMLEMVTSACDSGADAVKFQWTSSAKRLAQRRNAPEYKEAYNLIEFPMEWVRVLSEEAAKVGIAFLCTTYLPEDVAVVAPDVSAFKIASFEAMDLEFLAQHVARSKPVYISTGMMGEADLLWYLQRRNLWTELRLLHCVSAYPAPISDLNLGVIRKYDLDGYSDHSSHLMVGALAVASGAKVIEVHFRPENADPHGEDYHHSLSEMELLSYVRNIRSAEAMLGDGTKRPMPSEAAMEKYRVTQDHLATRHD